MSLIIKHPVATEKSIRLMESENKLIFVVDEKATKPQIKRAVEETFNVKVDKVHTLHTPGNKKRAYVTFNAETPAIDIATKLGLM
jgi:ribosomal protein uL23